MSAAKARRSKSSVTPSVSVVAIQRGPRAVVSGGRSVGAASSQAPEARCQRQVVASGGRRRLVGAEW